MATVGGVTDAQIDTRVRTRLQQLRRRLDGDDHDDQLLRFRRRRASRRRSPATRRRSAATIRGDCFEDAERQQYLRSRPRPRRPGRCRGHRPLRGQHDLPRIVPIGKFLGWTDSETITRQHRAAQPALRRPSHFDRGKSARHDQSPAPHRRASRPRCATATSGLALIEFAFSLPVLLTLGLFGLETANFAMAHLRVSNIAMLTADNAARVRDSIDEADVIELFTGAKMTGASIDFAPERAHHPVQPREQRHRAVDPLAALRRGAERGPGLWPAEDRRRRRHHQRHRDLQQRPDDAGDHRREQRHGLGHSRDRHRAGRPADHLGDRHRGDDRRGHLRISADHPEQLPGRAPDHATSAPSTCASGSTRRSRMPARRRRAAAAPCRSEPAGAAIRRRCRQGFQVISSGWKMLYAVVHEQHRSASTSPTSSAPRRRSGGSTAASASSGTSFPAGARCGRPGAATGSACRSNAMGQEVNARLDVQDRFVRVDRAAAAGARLLRRGDRGRRCSEARRATCSRTGRRS